MSDPLAQFWVHDIVIRRYTGATSYGPGYDDPVTVQGWVRDGTKLIAGPNGEQLMSSAQVALPPSTDYVPVESEVTLPTQFAAPGQTRTTRVISSSRADGGGLPTPDHLQLILE